MILFKTGKIRLGGGFNGLRRIQFKHSYHDIISLENLLASWKEFVCGKRKRKDVQEFGRDLMANIIALHCDLMNRIYQHSAYEAFKINDPKPRDIHKANVRDRLLHHAIHRILYPFFDRVFISDSLSCRLGKGTHRAMGRFRSFTYKITKNHTRSACVLKCDIRKFFASIDQKILLTILAKYIPDTNILALLSDIIHSFSSTEKGVGLPLGNLTSQLLVNVYMNEFDQFVKHKIKAKYYIRYADDFVIFSTDRVWLCSLIPVIQQYLSSILRLQLHPKKISIRTISSGVDYLGWIHFNDYRVLRSVAKYRMFRRLEDSGYNSSSVQSYYGLLKHGNAKKLRRQLEFEVEKVTKLKNVGNIDIK